MKNGMRSQENQKEYLRHLKNSGLIIGIVFTVMFVSAAIFDYILL